MKAPSFQELIRAIQLSWRRETSFVPEEWSEANPARGHCLVTTLVIQDYLGGDFVRYRVSSDDLPETHYCNVLSDGTIVDATGSQYKKPVILRVDPISLGQYASAREKYLAEKNTLENYRILKDRVVSILGQA